MPSLRGSHPSNSVIVGQLDGNSSSAVCVCRRCFLRSQAHVPSYCTFTILGVSEGSLQVFTSSFFEYRRNIVSIGSGAASEVALKLLRVT